MIAGHNIYEGEMPASGCEVFSTLVSTPRLRVESIRSDLKKPGEWYDQDEDEWVLLCEGEAELEIEGETLSLKRGDHLLIPRRTPHRVLSTSRGALWIGVFSF